MVPRRPPSGGLLQTAGPAAMHPRWSSWAACRHCGAQPAQDLAATSFRNRLQAA
jgi:hypothetical protein